MSLTQKQTIHIPEWLTIIIVQWGLKNHHSITKNHVCGAFLLFLSISWHISNKHISIISKTIDPHLQVDYDEVGLNEIFVASMLIFGYLICMNWNRVFLFFDLMCWTCWPLRVQDPSAVESGTPVVVSKMKLPSLCAVFERRGLTIIHTVQAGTLGVVHWQQQRERGSVNNVIRGCMA